MSSKPAQKCLQKLRRFCADTEAATSVEYAVILMLIGGSIITTIQLLGGSTTAFWEFNRDEVNRALTR